MSREEILEEVLLNLYSYLYKDDDGSISEDTTFSELEMDEEEIIDFVIDFENTFDCILNKNASNYKNVSCLIDAIADAVN